MRITFAVVVTAIFLSSCSHAAPSVDDEFLRGFVRAIEARDYEAIAGYVSEREKFFIGNRLRPDIDRFVYGGEEGGSSAFRSIIEIVQDGDLLFFPVAQADGSLIVSFVPSEYVAETEAHSFFENEWMKKYFACWFASSDGGIKLVYSFCFAETDGPYPRPYG